MLTRSGLPGPSTCRWPTNSSSDRGRMRSASGRNGARMLGSRGLTPSFPGRADHVCTRRGRKAELLRSNRPVALDSLEHDGRRLSELVLEDHLLQLPAGEAEQGPAKIRIGAARLDEHPVEPSALSGR